MQQFVTAVRKAVQDRNWYAALGVALTLPDVCGKMEAIGMPAAAKSSQARYVAWCETYLVPRYTGMVGGEQRVFLRGADCYALRCAFLHEGSIDLVPQRARVALDSFIFVVPPIGMEIHRNLVGKRLQVQTDVFCEDICHGVDKWLKIAQGHPDVLAAIDNLMKITEYGPNDTIII